MWDDLIVEEQEIVRKLIGQATANGTSYERTIELLEEAIRLCKYRRVEDADDRPVE